jgi:putative glutamine amidotransferase
MPFLGMGTGIQLLNTALGGSLRSVAGGGDETVPHIHPHNPRHPLQTIPGTLLHKLLVAGRSTLVSSSHAMAVDDVAVGLVVSARSPDGLVEAIESETSDWMALGVQFLPDPHADDLDDQIFRTFVHHVQHGRLQPV